MDARDRRARPRASRPVRPANTSRRRHAIRDHRAARRLGLLAHHGGHGIGRKMHEDPPRPNEGSRQGHWKLRPGWRSAIRAPADADGTDEDSTTPTAGPRTANRRP